jgi:hypothetical protein
MTAKPKKTKAPPADAALKSLERYEIAEVDRSQLVNAPYNPRILNDKARRKLKAGIKKVGLLAPPIWNQRTGHIVSGHQRVSLMDDLYGTQSYKLRVAAVHLTDAEEKEANILLNNFEAQGEFDIEKLGALLKDESIDLDGTGFDASDLYRLFGDAPATLARESSLDHLSEGVRRAAEDYEQSASNTKVRDSLDYYVVVVFKDVEDRDQFLEAAGFDDNRFQPGSELRRLILEKDTPS